MNSLWNFIDWILPSVRLSEDLEDPYAFSDDGSSALTATRHTSHSRIRAHQLQDRREWSRDRERETPRDQDREKDRRHIQGLERDRATLTQRVAVLEHDLQAARQSIATFSLLSSPIIPDHKMRDAIAHPLNPTDLRTSYDSLISSYSVMQQALHQRIEEVESLKSFLSKTDEWSGAQLIQSLRDLNAEIVQLSASVADEFASAFDRRVDRTRPSDRELVTSALGPVMTNLLSTRDHAGDPTLVQFAIQAWEIHCIGRVFDAFCFGLPGEVDKILTDVFEHMHRAEPQPTTSRWRALTVNHARSLISAQSQTQPNAAPFASLYELNIRGLLAVLAISGCTDTRGLHREPLRARFGTSLTRIGERAEKLATAMKEGVMSGVFEITWVSVKGAGGPHARKHDKEPWFDWSTMENVYAGHGSEKCRVLCTVEFGLICVRRASAGGDAASDHGATPSNGSVNGHGAVGGGAEVIISNGTDGILTRSLLLKPKVLLESVADIL